MWEVFTAYDVLAGYNTGIEKNRLREGLGLIEFERTKEILRQLLPAPPAVIYDIVGVIGPCWLIPQLDEFWKDEAKRESIMRIVRMCEKEESVLGLSTHLLSISRKEH